jgi:hypothetical protein
MELPEAVRPLKCRNPDCTLAEGGRCARMAEFQNPLDDCPELFRVETSQPGPAVVPGAAPWSGRHLDSSEVERLLRRSPARLIGVFGPFGAGKTCLITSFFLQLASGQRGPLPYRFASSLTLHGFRELMERASRWEGDPNVDIVDHTSKEQGVAPRTFLHVGLRPTAPTDVRHVDVLLSDVPGEWIKAWTGLQNEVSSRQLSFMSRCDGFVVLADASALLGPSGGKTDAETSMLVRRLVDLARETKSTPPLALVFSKYDRAVAAGAIPPSEALRLDPAAWGAFAAKARRTWNALVDAREAKMPVALFPVSAFPQTMSRGQPVGVMEPFAFVMSHVDRRDRWPRQVVSVPENARAFATMRRWEVDE